MSKSPIIWILKQNQRRIPAILLLTAAQVGQAFFLCCLRWAAVVLLTVRWQDLWRILPKPA